MWSRTAQDQAPKRDPHIGSHHSPPHSLPKGTIHTPPPKPPPRPPRPCPPMPLHLTPPDLPVHSSHPLPFLGLSITGPPSPITLVFLFGVLQPLTHSVYPGRHSPWGLLAQHPMPCALSGSAHFPQHPSTGPHLCVFSVYGTCWGCLAGHAACVRPLTHAGSPTSIGKPSSLNLPTLSAWGVSQNIPSRLSRHPVLQSSPGSHSPSLASNSCPALGLGGFPDAGCCVRVSVPCWHLSPGVRLAS